MSGGGAVTGMCGSGLAGRGVELQHCRAPLPHCPTQSPKKTTQRPPPSSSRVAVLALSASPALLLLLAQPLQRRHAHRPVQPRPLLLAPNPASVSDLAEQVALWQRQPSHRARKARRSTEEAHAQRQSPQ
eukprot:2240112-Rhodomonas_salina.1